MPQKTILIKKYENRRLYDATNSRYVNLEEVAGFLKNGHDVRVVDVVTGKDITRLILTQIIIEDARTPDSTFPVDVLRQMIAASGRASQESALRYMKAMLDMYQDTYRAIPPAVNPSAPARLAPQLPIRAPPPPLKTIRSPEKSRKWTNSNSVSRNWRSWFPLWPLESPLPGNLPAKSSQSDERIGTARRWIGLPALCWAASTMLAA